MLKEVLWIGFEDRFAKGVAMIALRDQEENKECMIAQRLLYLLVGHIKAEFSSC